MIIGQIGLKMDSSQVFHEMEDSTYSATVRQQTSQRREPLADGSW